MADVDERAELGDLAAALRAHLEVEQELGSHGIAVPRLKVEPKADRAPRPRPSAEVEALPARAVVAGVAAAAGPAARERDPAQVGLRLEQLAVEAAACTACVLHERRTKSVFARGRHDAELVFVGEGPGHDEDLAGLPFVGPAGQLLDRMIDAMGFARDEVYICNVVKCRPPENRTPHADEAAACARFLVPQLESVAPTLIVALGRCAAENLGVAQATGPWRGQWGSFQGIPVMPTYHPAYLLRSPEQKRVVWADLQLVLGRLGRSPRPRGSNP